MTRWLLPLVVLAAACSELPALGTDVCGNGIVERGEDCDQRDGECSNCRWVCKEDTPNECPNDAVGYVCAVDGLCYGPSGLFEQKPADLSAFPVLGFRITDVDGDGLGDVVGLNPTAINVRYGDSSGRLLDEYNVVTPQAQGNPVIANLVDPSVHDLVIPTADGLVVYTAAFGVPTPRQFPLGGEQGPENAMGRVDPFDAVQVGDTIGLFGQDVAAPVAPLKFGLIVITPLGPLFDVETTKLCEDAAGDPTTSPTSFTLWGGQIASYEAPSGTFISFSNGTRTCVVQVRLRTAEVDHGSTEDCRASAPGAPKCRYEVKTITTFNRFMYRPVFADLDNDGCPSLLGQDGGLGGILEFEGDDNNGECVIAGTALPSTIQISDPPGSGLIGSMRLQPPVTGMARDALISQYGIHAVPETITNPRPTTALYISDRQLGRAIAGDIDSDGNTDVVFSAMLPNLDIARRVPGSDNFLLVRTTTSGAVVETMIADYDGDLRDDLAYVESLGTAQRLSIAYGSPTGLEPGVAADVFTRVEFLAKMRVQDSTDPFDLVDDLIAIDLIGTPPAIEPEITILHGSPSRTMLSFFGLPVPLRGSAFRGAVGGRFLESTPNDTRTAGITDLVAFQTFRSDSTACVTQNCETALWVIPGLPNARLGDPQFVSADKILPSAKEVGACLDGPTSPFCITAAKLLAWPVSDNHDIVLGIDFRGTEAPSLLRFDPAQGWPGPSAVSKSFFANLPNTGRIHDLFMFDIDHDGIEELIVPFTSSVPVLGADGFTLICRMTREGMVLGCQDVAVDLLGAPNMRCIDADVGRLTNVCDPSGTGIGDELAVVCREPLGDPSAPGTLWQSYVIPIRSVDGQFVASLTESRHTATAKVDDIQFGDVTGDALDDIVALDITSGTAVLAVFAQYSSKEALTCGEQLLPQ